MALIILLLYIGYAAFAAIVFFLTVGDDAPPAAPGPGPSFASVVVAARNEEQDIRACLESLRDQRFPRDRYEVIVVDDHSTDGTRAIAESFALSEPNFRCVALPAGQTGRKQALRFGIETARGGLVFHIDADSVANPDWLAELSAGPGPGVPIAGGLTRVRTAGGPFAKIQALELLYHTAINAAVARSARPVLLSGNNMTFEKEAYERMGGYGSLNWGPTNLDYQLVRAFRCRGIGSARLIAGRRSVVTTAPIRSYGAYLAQKMRWMRSIAMGMSGGRMVVLPMCFAYAALSVYPFFTAYLVPVLLLRFLADVLIMAPTMRLFRDLGLMAWIVPFELHSTLMSLYIWIPYVLSPAVRWKGRKVT